MILQHWYSPEYEMPGPERTIIFYVKCRGEVCVGSYYDGEWYSRAEPTVYTTDRVCVWAYPFSKSQAFYAAMNQRNLKERGLL